MRKKVFSCRHCGSVMPLRFIHFCMPGLAPSVLRCDACQGCHRLPKKQRSLAILIVLGLPAAGGMLLAELGMASILSLHILAAVAIVLCGFVGMSADTLIAQEEVVFPGLTERSFFKDFLIFVGVPVLVVAVGFWLLLKYGG